MQIREKPVVLQSHARSDGRVWWFLTLSIAGAGALGIGCEGPGSPQGTLESRTLQPELKDLPAPLSNDTILGMEQPSEWSTTTQGAVLGQSTVHSQGLYALLVTPSRTNGYTPIKSAPLSTLAVVSPTLAVDIMLPTYQPNPNWQGTLQVYLNCPSRGIYSQFAGQVELTGKPLAVWNTINFSLTNSWVTSLLQAGYSDLTITVVLNVQVPTTGIYRLDNVRFLPVAQNGCRGWPNGTSCTDNNPCTLGDTCQSGTCRAGSPMPCYPLDQCHNAGTCVPATGICTNPPKSDGSSCTDGNPCTLADTCQSGLCQAGSPKPCTASDQCHLDGTCDPQTGICSDPKKPDGTGCDDQNMCTTADACQNGGCIGGPPPDCNDGTACTDDSCNVSTGCVHTPICQVGEICYNLACCKPKTCADLSAQCGSFSDTCGGTVTCGTCLIGNTCDPAGHCVPRVVGDYDGDGKTDITVWRPDASANFFWISSANSNGYWAQWGATNDIPVTGDYDGDGKADWVIYRPTTGTWYVSLSNTATAYSQQWGQEGDIPTPGDYDGDGKNDIAVWRSLNATWYVINSATWTGSTTPFGAVGDIPVPGDYDGDGRTDLAVWRPTNGTWYGVNSSNGSSWSYAWGQSGDIPVPGDYDNDRKSDYAVWRPSNGNWYVTTQTGVVTTTQWGAEGDVPAPGDYDGDGKTDKVVWRPSNATWYVMLSSTGATSSTVWGSGGTNQGGGGSDVPMPNAPGVRTLLIMLATGQQMGNWCWAASEEMTAGYYGVSLNQCDLANAEAGQTQCCSANPPGACDTGGCFTLTGHGFTESVRQVLDCGSLTPAGGVALTFAELTAELAANRPVAFAWSWTGGGGHEMVAIGSWTTTTGQEWVEMNDPEPGPVNGTQTDLLYTAWISGVTYRHQRDTYNIRKN